MALPKNNFPSIGLSMIMKDEANVILRCLESCYEIIDYYTVVDTGSSDLSALIVKDFFDSKGIKGQILNHRFINFEDARNYALNKSKYNTDFCFTIDADETLNIPDGLKIEDLKEQLSKTDIGLIKMHSGNVSYLRRAFWRTSKSFRYKFPVHELLLCDEQEISATISGISVNRINDGASWNQTQKEKYLGHAKLLHDYIDKNGLEPRCVFYLAQSYKDAGDKKKAIEWYEKRTTISGGFREEIYWSRLMVGKLKWELGYPIMEIADEFMRAGEWDSERAEHLYELKLMYERNNRPQGALKMAELLKQYKFPDRVLFVNPNAYNSQAQEMKSNIIPMRAEPYLINGLNKLIQTIKDSGGDTSNMNMIEIGSYSGESTVMFAKHFKKVVAVDAWEDGYDNNDLASKSMPLSEVEKVFDERTKDFSNISKIKRKSDDALPYIQEEIHFVYIDGMHTFEQVKKDIENYLPLLKGGNCFIAGHDFSDGWIGVKNAVIESLGAPDWIFEDTSWLLKVIDVTKSKTKENIFAREEHY